MGREFSADWASANVGKWQRALLPFRDRRTEILEIGSWEGRSAIQFLEMLPLSRITCVDTFAGTRHQKEWPEIATVEQRFDANLAPFGSRVEKIKSRSTPALDRLAESGRSFDVIYVDGSHDRDDVLLDSVLSWRLLREQGVIIWDDYTWGNNRPPEHRAQEAIDLFMAIHRADMEVMEIGAQVIARKLPAEAEPRPLPGRTMRRTLGNFFRFLTHRPMH